MGVNQVDSERKSLSNLARNCNLFVIFPHNFGQQMRTTTVLYALALLTPALGVKRGDFKTCDESGFCKRIRALADRATEHGASWKSPYGLERPTFSDGTLRAGVSNTLFPNIHFSLEVRFQEDGVARILMDEVDGLRQRYNETGMWAVQTEPKLEQRDSAFVLDLNADHSSVLYANGRHELRIQHRPILLTFLRDGQPHIVLNEKGLFNMEHFRLKSLGGEPEEVVVQDEEHPGESLKIIKEEAFPGFLPTDEDGMWEESFSGKADSKPKGSSARLTGGS